MLLKYLRSRLGILGLFLLFLILCTVTYTLYGLPLPAVIYPLLLCGLIFLIAGVIDFLHTKHLHDELLRSSTVPQTADPLLEDSRKLVEKLNNDITAQHASDEAAYNDMKDYYTVWAHQIKTPIASMKLMLKNEDTPLSRHLTSELSRTEQYVDMAMAYMRLESDSTDFVFREYRLDELLRSCIRKTASEFILRRLSLDYTPTELTLVTDRKWFSFVIDQLLSNALKYTKEGGIRIFTEDNTLCISDTGIGIADSDLPRIFEKGYTGFNGRTDQSASGIGLYLCRRICKQLNIDITAGSEIGKGTTIKLTVLQNCKRM